jgi:1,4-alpha-glucan branching enzyme
MVRLNRRALPAELNYGTSTDPTAAGIRRRPGMITTKDDGSVEFAYFRPGAEQVALAGDFNHWRAEAHPMQRDDHGWWRLRLALPEGEYRFKYIVDRALWEADFAAYGVELSELGGWTSVLVVAPADRTRRSVAA